MEVNSSEIAYRKLRERILSGDLKAGVALKERDLCAELGISRTPVREALRRLSTDGLVDMAPRRSIRVSNVEMGELSEIYEVGRLLQSHAVGLAARKATQEDINRLEVLVEEMEAVTRNDKEDMSQAFSRLDHEFHSTISQIARNSRIANFINQTISLQLVANVMHTYAKEDFAKSNADHRKILAALKAGDEKAASAAMASHVAPRA